MEPQSSKAQLRSRVRTARANRARVSPVNPAHAAGADPTGTEADPSHKVGADPSRTEEDPSYTAGADPSRTEAVPGVGASVADTTWEVIRAADARVVLGYAALPGEPDLDPALDRFLAAGGTVYLPVVTKVGEPLAFGEVTGSMASLEPQGKWGIREPADGVELLTAAQLLSPEVGLDLLFIPALGFGADGARLGNGGGFYDRTFGPHGVAPLDHGGGVLGVCFTEELGLSGLTAEEWDLRIPSAITEDGVHTFTGEQRP
ncbi:5-formyltetrahydrofolate cyclo-ligase [Brevibacterium spongiae]|uniref:5-formyltetrahydrofolate cyclo-ligase n=1 Tax=Brevibacterium spongiae TaxID=2909672 RepID=A0ABY5SNF3_9MICO|nr:5-formyltetrahydrofolate cyclo-ligase [Brevibacterium spongiae]UVI35426.1 5-formyltetrahydrofolate cyclo-ligase [Brevibacterium spongiae]